MGTQLQPSQLNSPGKDIESYLASVHSIPILTKEQEQELALKLYEEDDLDAARQLVIHHLRFVVHIARSYQGYGLPLADIIQEGNVGLMKAVDKYDPHRGVKVVSFAVHWIKAEIHEYILKNWRLVKIATTKAQRKLFFNLRSKKKSLEWLTKEEAEKIAKDLNVEVKDVLHMENRLSSNDASFDAPAAYDDDDEVEDFIATRAPAHHMPSASGITGLVVGTSTPVRSTNRPRGNEPPRANLPGPAIEEGGINN